ncbi:MAG: putative quinol monooxygenase [Flavobacteriales bacterium]
MIRIVKMTFAPENVDAFLKNFNENKTLIRNFDGVEHLELFRDKNNPNIFFTYSYWKSEEYLEKYRVSDLFKSVWAKTKPLFSADAEAWSVDSIYNVNQ